MPPERLGKPPMKSSADRTLLFRRLAFAALGFVAAVSVLVMVSACTVDSANAVSRSVSADVTGVYRYDSDSCNNDGRFVSANSGSRVIYFDVRQIGDQLEAIDNNGIIFRGTIGHVSDSSASFNITGSTTAGNGVTVSGSIEIGSGKGVMRATWIEDNFFATVCGSANGPAITETDPGTNVTTNAFFRINDRGMKTEEIASYRKLALWFCEG